MEMRFAGDEADLASLMEQESIRQALLELSAEAWAQEQELMREIMRLRPDRLQGGNWISGAEGWEV